jgi:hypothetical protein
LSALLPDSPQSNTAEAPADLTCTTNAQGTCTIPGAATPATPSYRRWSALVSAAGFGPLYVSDVSQVSQGMQTRGRGLQGKLVLDRKLVKPGQKLYVKGECVTRGIDEQ